MKNKKLMSFATLSLAGLMLLGACAKTNVAESSTVAETAAEESQVETKTEEATEGSQEVVKLTNLIEGVEYEVEFSKAPERAISLSGFMTEMFLSLGLEEHMVGYGYQDNAVLPQYQEALNKVEEISKAENPSKEVVLSKEPDFMTGWKSTFSEKNFNKEFCDTNGIYIYIPRSEYPNAGMEEVYADFENMGKIFGVEDRAKEIIATMKSEIASIEEKVADKEKVRVFIFDSGEAAPFTASAGLATDMISKAGGENVFAGTEKNWMEVSWEAVIEKDPEVIIIMDYDASNPASEKEKFLLNYAPIAEVSAIKNERIFTLGLSDVLAGERDVQTIQEMAKRFHPEAFE